MTMVAGQPLPENCNMDKRLVEFAEWLMSWRRGIEGELSQVKLDMEEMRQSTLTNLKRDSAFRVDIQEEFVVVKQHMERVNAQIDDVRQDIHDTRVEITQPHQRFEKQLGQICEENRMRSKAAEDAHAEVRKRIESLSRDLSTAISEAKDAMEEQVKAISSKVPKLLNEMKNVEQQAKLAREHQLKTDKNFLAIDKSLGDAHRNHNDLHDKVEEHIESTKHEFHYGSEARQEYLREVSVLREDFVTFQNKLEGRVFYLEETRRQQTDVTEQLQDQIASMRLRDDDLETQGMDDSKSVPQLQFSPRSISNRAAEVVSSISISRQM